MTLLVVVRQLQKHRIVKTKIKIFEDGGFELHKWNSNASWLEGEVDELNNDLTYAKQLLQSRSTWTSPSGLGRNKAND